MPDDGITMETPESKTTIPMRLVLAAPAMLAMLERLEWCVEKSEGAYFCDQWDPGDDYQSCPVCEARESDGHTGDCELAALLKAARGE